MWPSRIERTASAIGSFMSSPSTSTVYRPVIDPRSLVPARSSRRGSRRTRSACSRGWPGGSPMARPTSRWAMAKRVTESIISITSSPWSRKCSAIAVAVNAARIRTSAGWSEVATTTTECARASPRSRSMNSRTSRPRSPTSAITLTSAVVDRAIIPSSDDLPTPEPAKMPRRWPRPQGTSVSSARTPRPTRSVIRGRVSASGGGAVVLAPGHPRGRRTRPAACRARR